MKFNALLSLSFLLAFTDAQAVPTIYPGASTKNFLGQIVNSTNSNLVADDDQQNVIYVKPPNSAFSTVGGLHTRTANLGFCKEMADTQAYSRRTTERIAQLLEEEMEAETETQKVKVRLNLARVEIAKHVTLGKLDEIVALDIRVDTIEARIVELTEKLMACTQYCQNLREEIKELRAEKIVVTKERRTLAAAHTKELREYEKKKALVASIVEELQEREDAWVKINARLNTVRSNFHSMYTSFGKMEGARASLQFESDWDKNIQTLRDANPGIDFKKIHTQKVVITTNIADINNLPSGGAILDYQIGGTVSEGKLVLPSYPENMSGNVRLSLLGACPAIHPEYFDLDIPGAKDEMKYGMTVSYEFPTNFVTKAEAKYSMYKMYQKIVSSGSKGGFFKSRSWSNVEEKNFFRDSFEVIWSEQDAGNALSQEQKDVMEAELRKNVLSRLATIGLPAYVNAGGIVPATAPGKTGAAVISESLYKNCPGNYYCVGAAIAMDVLQAIFGSSSTSASYTNIQDIEVKESWSRNMVLYKPWVTTYINKKETEGK